MFDNDCVLYGIWTMYMFRDTLPSAAAVLCDECQLVWVQPGIIEINTYIAYIIPVPSECIWL
jgi:hypothetical protein